MSLKWCLCRRDVTRYTKQSRCLLCLREIATLTFYRISHVICMLPLLMTTVCLSWYMKFILLGNQLCVCVFLLFLDDEKNPPDIFAVGFEEMVELNAGNIVSARSVKSSSS